MNRWFQGMLAVVIAVVAISGVSGKEPRQLTDAESRQVVGSSYNYVCYVEGTCACSALPPPQEGQSESCVPCGPGNSCRYCDGASSYRFCVFYLFATCTDATISCGHQWDGAMCYDGPNRCVKVSVSTDLGECNCSS